MAVDTERALTEEAISWIKAHAADLIDRFARACPPAHDAGVSIFMAGSPGAGKTEFSKRLLGILEKNKHNVVRIDPDEIREWLPMYIAGKAEFFQPAVAIAVEKLHDYVLAQNKHFLLDGTSSKLDKLRSNIQRSLDKGRGVYIEYVYQDPLVAWDFTQKRELIEGRNIPKEAFVEQLFAAYANIETIKTEFGGRIGVDLIQRNIQTSEYVTRFDIQTVAEHLHLPYTREELTNQL